MDISGSAAIITGGASGLGAATAQALVDRGAIVTLIDLNTEAGDAKAADLGGATRFVQADVTHPGAIADAVALASEDAPLRIVINCAGIAIGARTVDRGGDPANLDAFTSVVRVNLIGTYNVSSQAASVMARNEPLAHGERGVIINTASVAAFDGQIGQTAYSASKGGIVGLTLPMARDLSSIGVRVNTIAPGIIDTPLLGSLNDEIREALAANVPFPKRLGTPEDFASLAVELISNGYMNGETIRLDGALRMAPR
ncbi:MAG: 3-hydroxyacyl-CoA dehydrogenase [Actinobacteria bacterium]|nr:MAG: 3-hydroxyacyl-CoA dehydrogenase [Actinomycetota bacterium]